jgi:hypothetical protein
MGKRVSKEIPAFRAIPGPAFRELRASRVSPGSMDRRESKGAQELVSRARLEFRATRAFRARLVSKAFRAERALPVIQVFRALPGPALRVPRA